MKKFYYDQIDYESKIVDYRLDNPSDWPKLTPASRSDTFSSIRFFIENTGFIKGPEPSWMPQKFTPDFTKHLQILDKTPARYLNTTFIFYHSSKHKKIKKITDLLTSMNQKIQNEDFLEFLLTLGYPVNVHTHDGWTGNSNTSWNCSISEQKDENLEINPPSVFDGSNYCLYHSTDIEESVFLVPGLKTPDLKQSPSKAFSSRVVIIWREESTCEDSSLPEAEMLEELIEKCCQTGLETPKDQTKIPFIIIEPLNSGLYKILIMNPDPSVESACSLPLQLADANLSIVGKTVLGVLIRDTIRNIGFRQRLGNELGEACHVDSEILFSSPPHLKRRQLIGDMTKKFTTDLTEEQIICRLLNDATVEIEGIRKTTDVTTV